MAPKARHKWARHVAIVLRGSNIISIAVNHEYTHAEVQALNNLWPSERRGTKMYSIRLTRSGEFSMAKPCPDCERYMRESGVKMVYYTDAVGNMIKERL